MHAGAENGCLAGAGGRDTLVFLTTQAPTVEDKVGKSRA